MESSNFLSLKYKLIIKFIKSLLVKSCFYFIYKAALLYIKRIKKTFNLFKIFLVDEAYFYQISLTKADIIFCEYFTKIAKGILMKMYVKCCHLPYLSEYIL